jgi:hypothetical protein
MIVDYKQLNQAVNEIESKMIDRATGGNPVNYSCYRNILLSEFYQTSDNEFKNSFPTLVQDYSSLNAFWGFIKSEFQSYDERRKYIYEQFLPIRRYLDSRIYDKKSKLIDPEIVLSNDYIQHALDKANQRIKNHDFDGAITVARTLLEEVQSKIYQELNGDKEPNHKGNLNNLYNSITKSLSLHIDNNLDSRLKSILSGLYSINDGIANLRNAMSDAHAKKFRPLAHHARLAVNCSFTFCQFLCDTYLYQRNNYQKTRGDT